MNKTIDGITMTVKEVPEGLDEKPSIIKKYDFETELVSKDGILTHFGLRCFIDTAYLVGIIPLERVVDNNAKVFAKEVKKQLKKGYTLYDDNTTANR